MVNGKTTTTGTMAKWRAVVLLLIVLRKTAFLKQCFYFALNFAISFIGARHNTKRQNKEGHYKSKKFHRLQK